MQVEIAELKANLAQTDRNLAGHPQQLGNSLTLVLTPYLEAVGQGKIASDNLAVELRRAAVIEASIAESGWRGIGAALAAIFKHQNLLTMVGALMLSSGLLGAVMAWNLGANDRRILEQNRQVTQECNTNHASDKDKNGWYTCRLWQLPMPKK